MDKDEKRKFEAEKRRMRKATAAIQAKINSEPKLKCTFVNLETKGADLDFTYEGLKFHLDDGKECELPITIIEHLNGLKVPQMKFKTDPETGMIKPETEVRTMIQRFSVTPTNLAQYTRALAGDEEAK